MQEYLQETFRPGGYLSRCLAGYAPRQGQIDYAEAVDLAIRQGSHLMVEGPTGTGKSLAYGVPAIYHAASSGKRVVIATSNIALQEQLMTKDLPLLAEALPWPFTYRMLKGKSNYLCMMRTEEERQDAQGQLFPEEREQQAEILTWSSMTQEGDRSELPFEPKPRVWKQFSASSDECVGGKACSYAKECFSAQARAGLETAQVIVVNYSLLFSHIKVKEATGRDIILPAFDVLIMDEGHEAPEWARGFLGFRVSSFALDRVARDVGGGDQADLISASETFFHMLGSYYRSGRYKTRLKDRLSKKLWGDVYDHLMHSSDQLEVMHGAAEDPMERAKLRKSSKRAAQIALQLEEAMLLHDSEVAYYIEEMKGGSVALCSKPAHVGEWVRDNLFDGLNTVVVTSATMTTNGGFGYIAGELGADHYDELVVGSPFDWRRQTILVLPTMPDPRDRGFGDAVARKVLEAVEQSKGRTLALFTSYRNLNIAYELVKDAVPYCVMKQGDLPRTQLMEEFKDDVDSVLLATTSFWSGIDVPGAALSCLVVDKLPFPRPDDPVLDLLQERDNNCFFNHSVPRAIISLKQGVGRLIRTVDDVGVVVLLDCRLTTKGYGKVFLNSLPAAGRTRKMSEIRRFLDHMLAAAQAAQV